MTKTLLGLLLSLSLTDLKGIQCDGYRVGKIRLLSQVNRAYFNLKQYHIVIISRLSYLWELRLSVAR
jgi:hypothetical protein